MWFYVTGILTSATLAPEIDSSVLVGFPPPKKYLGLDGHPTTIYVRTVTSQTAAVYNVLAATANPEEPQRGRRQPTLGRAHRPRRRAGSPQRALPRPRRRLTARRRRRRRQHHDHLACSNAARRSACGARSAPPRGTSAAQFLIRSDPARLARRHRRRCCSALLPPPSMPTPRHWAVVIPTLAWAGGLGAAFAIGAIAGLLPAIRAARLSPTDALRTV